MLSIDPTKITPEMLPALAEMVKHERARKHALLIKQHDEYGNGPGCYRLRCARCRGKFYATYPRARFCSYRCRNDEHIERRKARREAARKMRCAQCRRRFDAARIDAKFCTAACRQKAHRESQARDG